MMLRFDQWLAGALGCMGTYGPQVAVHPDDVLLVEAGQFDQTSGRNRATLILREGVRVTVAQWYEEVIEAVENGKALSALRGKP